MDKFKHPIIVGAHKLKLSNLEQLAKDLALKLNAKIEIESKEELIITFESKKPIYTGRLIQKNFNLIPQFKYQLNLNEFKLMIYEDFIEILFLFEVDYFHLYDLSTKEELKKIDTFHKTFTILNILGVREIFVGIFEEFGKGKELKYKWKNVLKEINTLQHFKVSI
ncbi:hypothetical protein [Flavobacterium sp.]|uniref:hypothetical protein n=1 Tax=Flavobacterium sp. TaxID=239 RepID=UPI002638D8E5|nr:hypothetical protein [Flavobacterium sp.]MDD3005004.1 hypothetical protein [Flavobacterium sp.]